MHTHLHYNLNFIDKIGRVQTKELYSFGKRYELTEYQQNIS